jgi:hypothetical protein
MRLEQLLPVSLRSLTPVQWIRQNIASLMKKRPNARATPPYLKKRTARIVDVREVYLRGGAAKRFMEPPPNLFYRIFNMQAMEAFLRAIPFQYEETGLRLLLLGRPWLCVLL